MKRHADHRGRIDRFRRLFDDHYGAVVGYVRRRVPTGDCDDVVAEIFMVAWRRLDAIPESPDDRLWLFGVARRTVAASNRATSRRDRLNQRVLSDGEVGAADRDDPVVDRVRVAFSRLRREDREVLELFYWEELSHAQIARVVRCSEAAVAQRLSRARRRLRDRLAMTPSSLVAKPPGSATARPLPLAMSDLERRSL